MNRAFAWPVGQVRGPVAPVGAYVAATLGGGIVLGGTVAVLVAVLTPIAQRSDTRLAALGFAVFAVLLELTGRMALLPQRHRQVDRERLAVRSRTNAAMVFGLQLGSVGNILIHHAAAYGLLLGLLVAHRPALAVAAGAAFGLTRGAMLLGFYLSATDTAKATRMESWLMSRLYRRLTRYAIGGATSVAIAIALMATGGINAV